MTHRTFPTRARPNLVPRALIAPALVLLASAALAGGCQTARTAYYDAWEGVGYAKRERLTDNVKAARAEQAEAKQQFASALEEFKSVVNFDGGDVERAYDKLNGAYQRCQGQADDVNGRIDKVKSVAKSLFGEWQGEVKQIQDDPSLQAQSQKLYDATRASYDEMIGRMDAAAASMTPVLRKFKNRVLFVKGSLNAQAIASLRGTEVDLGADIDKLIREMEASIAEADEFIAQTGGK